MDKRTRPTTPVSVLIPTKNDAANLERCLAAIHEWADEVVVVDSGSTDGTVEIAKSFGAQVVQFKYAGGWPKKRQWALDTYSWRNDWTLLLDADEILEDPIKEEIDSAIESNDCDGYRLRFCIVFLGRTLRHGDASLWKLSLFRRDKGRYEKRLENQDESMADMEVHEHVVVDGQVGQLKNVVRHENINSLDRYIEKHNAYSNWEARVFLEGLNSELAATPFGTQAQRRRWLKKLILPLPGFSLAVFLYAYLWKWGFLDGRPGLIYAGFRAAYCFQIKAKIYEQQIKPPAPSAAPQPAASRKAA